MIVKLEGFGVVVDLSDIIYLLKQEETELELNLKSMEHVLTKDFDTTEERDKAFEIDANFISGFCIPNQPSIQA